MRGEAAEAFQRVASFRGLASAILETPEDVEDALQNARIDAWSRAEEFDATRGSAGAWIYGIVRSRSIDAARSRARRAKLLAVVAAEPRSEFVPEPVSEGDRVTIALARLPATMREAIELSYFRGLSCAEIAAAGRLPIGTVKSRLRLALVRLAAILEA